MKMPFINGLNLQEKNEIFEVTFQNDVKVLIRNENHSDSNVFHQIFVFKEYDLVQKIMTLNNQFAKKKNIIDAGANVGYTTVYFSNFFDKCNIFAVEPSQENAKMFQENVKNLLKTISSKGQPLDYEETNIAEITTKFQSISNFIKSERGQDIIDTLPKQKRD